MPTMRPLSLFFFFNDTATTEIYTLSLHDALPIYQQAGDLQAAFDSIFAKAHEPPFQNLTFARSEEHTSELQSHLNLVCRLLLEKKKKDVQQRFCEPSKLTRMFTLICAAENDSARC